MAGWWGGGNRAQEEKSTKMRLKKAEERISIHRMNFFLQFSFFFPRPSTLCVMFLFMLLLRNLATPLHTTYINYYQTLRHTLPNDLVPPTATTRSITVSHGLGALESVFLARLLLYKALEGFHQPCIPSDAAAADAARSLSAERALLLASRYVCSIIS